MHFILLVGFDGFIPFGQLNTLISLRWHLNCVVLHMKLPYVWTSHFGPVIFLELEG